MGQGDKLRCLRAGGCGGRREGQVIRTPLLLRAVPRHTLPLCTPLWGTQI